MQPSDRIAYLKDMERKLKQLVFDWKKAEEQEDKKELLRQMHALLFKTASKAGNGEGEEKAELKIR